MIELLVVVAIVTLLIGLLLPALRAVRGQARALHCASNLRSVAMEFGYFAEGTAALGQGDSELLGPHRFRINDFQDQLYRLDEFWDGKGAVTATLQAGRDMSLCPAGATQLTKREGLPCGRESLTPLDGVSLAFNMRLYRGVIELGGQQLLAPVQATMVRDDILNHAYVPLVMDVDASAAVAAGFDPFYIAPGGSANGGPYAGGKYWAPSSRHVGKTNIAFVGGHVLASAHPEDEVWNWDYTASVGR